MTLRIIQSCSKTVSSGHFPAMLLKFPFFWYAPLRHAWLVPNVSRKLIELTLKARNNFKNVRIFLVTKCPPVVWPTNYISSKESPADPTVTESIFF
jgi:hypothetical protein